MTFPVDTQDPDYAPYVGYINGPQGSVISADNVYISADGLAYRHYKNADRTEFWDELLVSSDTVIDEDAPLNGVGPQYPDPGVQGPQT